MSLLSKYLRIRKLLVVFLFLFKNILYSQNLIQNSSFEVFNYPADWNNWSGQFINYSETPVKRILLSWDEFNSADFLPSACTHTYSGVPKNLFGFCNAKDGNNYCGFITFIGNGNQTKEYIYQNLSTPLIGGKTYCLSFYISRADVSTGAIKNIGAYFSSNLQSTGSLGYINVIPQIVNQNGFLTDTTQWVQIQDCFIANGGEQYITIGNFNSNANTDTLYTGSNFTGSTSPYYSYYYIDDITLIDQTTVEVNELDKNIGIEIYPNPASDILNIDLGNFNKDNLSIKITDMLGRKMLLTNYKSQIDIFFLEKGIYFVSVQQSSKTLGVKKIVKQ